MLRVELSGEPGPRHEAVVTIRAVTLASGVAGEVGQPGCRGTDAMGLMCGGAVRRVGLAVRQPLGWKSWVGA